MRSYLIPLLFSLPALLTNGTFAQDNSFLIANPATLGSSPDAYYETPRETPQRLARAVPQPSRGSQISSVMPPVDLLTREPAVNENPANVHAQTSLASGSVDEQMLPAFAVEPGSKAVTLDPAMIKVAPAQRVWPAQASPFPVNSNAQQTGSSQFQSQQIMLPSATLNNDEYYVPAMPVAATKTLPPANLGSHHRAESCSGNRSQPQTCCDEWKGFMPCKPINYDCSCNTSLLGGSAGCGCHANCPNAGCGKHGNHRRRAGCQSQNGCNGRGDCTQDCNGSMCRSDNATGESSSAQNDNGRDTQNTSPRFSFLTITINR
jgi:hypothetical protein